MARHAGSDEPMPNAIEYRMGPGSRVEARPSQMELTHHNVALTIIASAAIARLDGDDREDVMEEASEQMEDAFGDGAHVEVEQVTPDE